MLFFLFVVREVRFSAVPQAELLLGEPQNKKHTKNRQLRRLALEYSGLSLLLAPCRYGRGRFERGEIRWLDLQANQFWARYCACYGVS